MDSNEETPAPSRTRAQQAGQILKTVAGLPRTYAHHRRDLRDKRRAELEQAYNKIVPVLSYEISDL